MADEKKDMEFVMRRNVDGIKIAIPRHTYEQEDRTLRHFALSMRVMTGPDHKPGDNDCPHCGPGSLRKGFLDAFNELHKMRLSRFVAVTVIPLPLERYEEHVKEVAAMTYEEAQRAYMQSAGVHACSGGKVDGP